MDAPRRAFLGLGSNLGDRRDNLAQARARVAALPGTRLLAESRLYLTRPVGRADQPDFLNQVVEVETTLSPRALLGYLKQMEWDLGRRPGVRWGPREIDLDILVMEGVEMSEPDLVIPHPRLGERAFVLMPLAELAPQILLPSGETVAEAAARVGRQGVEPVDL